MGRTKSLEEFIPENERFFHQRRRDARNNMAEQEELTLQEYATPSLVEKREDVIVYPTVATNNFEIKHALLNLVQQN